jgi:hypothetical protein
MVRHYFGSLSLPGFHVCAKFTAHDRALAVRDVRLIGLTTGDYSATRDVLPQAKRCRFRLYP